MRQAKHLAGYLAFLCAAVFFLSGADRGTSPMRGGTLPLRGGTLPLRMPADGVLPLVMAGDVSALRHAKILMSMDVELAAASAAEAEFESLQANLSAPLPRQQSMCADLFGPLWRDAAGSGRILVADEELEVSGACSHEVTGEVSLVLKQAREGDDAVTCFVTGLQASEDLAVLTGELSCSVAVAGIEAMTFRLGE